MKRFYNVMHLLGIFIVCINGCCSKSSDSIKVWEPSEEQCKRAESIAYTYSEKNLDLDKDQLYKMKAKFSGRLKDDRKIIDVRFYDPDYFSNEQQEMAIFGGYPHYFVVTIDVNSCEVIDIYKSRE